MNKVILTGRMTKDPETRFLQSGTAVATFTLAVDRLFKKEGQPSADFISFVAWNKLAEVIANNLHKGSKVLVEGRIQTRSYDAQDGSKRYVTEVVANNVEFLDTKSQGNQSQQSAPQSNAQAQDIEVPF